MYQLERRVARIEDTCGPGDEDKPARIDLGDGQVYEMTLGEWREILDEIDGSRHYPEILRSHRDDKIGQKTTE